MDIFKATTSAALLVALALTPMPAAAQSRARPNGDRARGAVERGGQGQRYSAPPQSRGQSAPRGGGAVRRDAAPQQYVPRSEVRGGGAVRRDAPRQQYYAPRADVRGGGPARGYAVPRRDYYAPRPEARYGYSAPRYYGRPSHGYGYRPRFERPYYVFRPHTHIGFGLWLGFGVPYPTAYIATYPPPVYGYYGGRFCAVPGARVYGGISFDIAPAYAPVYVDGNYIGVASDFGPYAQPLTLVPGLHRVMISVGGYRPINWNVTVVAGQVIPFHGNLAAY